MSNRELRRIAGRVRDLHCGSYGEEIADDLDAIAKRLCWNCGHRTELDVCAIMSIVKPRGMCPCGFWRPRPRPAKRGKR